MAGEQKTPEAQAAEAAATAAAAAAKKSADDAAAAAKKIADDAAAAKEADDITKTDTSKFDDTQKNDYIDKLKDENARRRIENKKLKDAQTKQEDDLAKTKEKLTELTTKVGEYDTKEKERTLAGKTEIEKLSAKVTEMETNIADRDTKLQNLEKDKATNDLKLKQANRENMVDRLARQLDIEFASDFERKGLITELLALKDDDFFLTDDEVIYKVNALAKERKTKPITPGPGPQSRATGTPLTEEIKTLLAKDILTPEDKKRLDELTVELDKEVKETQV